MENLPKDLERKLEMRRDADSFRQLGRRKGAVDFLSNDYLGLAANEGVFSWASQLVSDRDMLLNGAGGSRLLSGNHSLYERLEDLLKQTYGSHALVFNSGYDANLGFFSAVPQRADLVLYDELVHASIRDGMRLGAASTRKYPHNDLSALEALIVKEKATERWDTIFVVTESVFSMDGDSPELQGLSELCQRYNCLLVVDEAHAVGVYVKNGMGLLEEAEQNIQVFARIITFGKALGAHGAAILGSEKLKDYLVNFARSFIYTTALPPHSVATVIAAYHLLQTAAGENKRKELLVNIEYFIQQRDLLGLQNDFIPSKSAIQSCLIPGNQKAREIASALIESGFEVRAVLSPTVPQGRERLRICLHAYNSKTEIREILVQLKSALTEK